MTGWRVSRRCCWRSDNADSVTKQAGGHFYRVTTHNGVSTIEEVDPQRLGQELPLAPPSGDAPPVPDERARIAAGETAFGSSPAVAAARNAAGADSRRLPSAG